MPKVENASGHLQISAAGLAISVARAAPDLSVSWAPSPNYDERPADTHIELLVIHAISLPPGQFGGAAIEQFFLNQLDVTQHPYFSSIAHLKVSAHFLIRREGALVQFVSCAKRAWHAGESNWRGRSRCNDFSIGIELEGCDETAFMPAQYDSLVALTRAIQATYPIADIVGHSDIAPGRKTDPGPFFDWPAFRRRAQKNIPNSSL
ncbi:MAG: 1,6-anhydro-N-acetylmuramyl-L-alanine amidase AmpD [Pseudomonadota bacterium]